MTVKVVVIIVETRVEVMMVMVEEMEVLMMEMEDSNYGDGADGGECTLPIAYLKLS